MAGESGRRGLFFFLCSLLAILAVGSKENALMLPISIILYDIILIQGVTRASLLRMLKYTWIPMAVLVLLVFIYADLSADIECLWREALYSHGASSDGAAGLDLLHHAAALSDPLRLTLLHDVEISRSIFEPWTTLPAMLAVTLFCVAAVAMARKKPLLSYCVLFFFLNHLIEGTIIPLELIYEHRNYIPSMLFFVPMAVLMVRCLDYFSYRRGFQIFHGRRLRSAPGLPGAHDLRAKRDCQL